ncbi:hypothetical protein ACQP2T_04075 [Nonomuraea sp. CA-143628]|uniref:hypothetical protein n=1 Tax=Nonomuraea sp. CA-143628 TaxID=3239997 RepID=UPI003D8F2FF0
MIKRILTTAAATCLAAGVLVPASAAASAEASPTSALSAEATPSLTTAGSSGSQGGSRKWPKCKSREWTKDGDKGGSSGNLHLTESDGDGATADFRANGEYFFLSTATPVTASLYRKLPHGSAELVKKFQSSYGRPHVDLDLGEGTRVYIVLASRHGSCVSHTFTA